MILGIVGSEQKKWTPSGEALARLVITEQITRPNVSFLTSGHCHLGGVDIWAEEIAKKYDKFREDLIFPAKAFSWAKGYKPRNILIAKAADHVISIAPDREKKGRTAMVCDHCLREDDMAFHVTSGGCWTMRYARKIGKTGHVIVIPNWETYEHL